MAPLKLHSTLSDMSVIVEQALHKEMSCRLEEDDDTTIFFTCSKDTASRNTGCGALPC